MAPQIHAAAATVSLDDKYELDPGRVLISGTQALVRVLLQQRALDRGAGLNTAGFVTGYRGSPLGGLDTELWSEAKRLAAADVVFQPGVNEELAATAVWGTQQSALLPGATKDGVFALWYAKGPGVDRAGDALKHGNRQGAARHGGVLVCVGDDHPGKSSTVAHQSEQALASHHIPVLYPSSVQEILEYGTLGLALSRYSGLWIGLKLVNETAEGTATIDVDSRRCRYATPEAPAPAAGRNTNARPMLQREDDESLVTRFRLPAVHAFVRANGVDRVVQDSPRRRLGIVTAGKSCAETLLALAALGIDAARAADLGIRVYKVGLVWPLEPQGLRDFARGHEELLFVEEKAAFLETQAARLLYDLPAGDRPRLVGKHDEHGAELLPDVRQIEHDALARVVGRRLERMGLLDEPLRERLLALAPERDAPAARSGASLTRVPYFCSGCPHNRSTRVPDGSFAMAGIGCHVMAGYMDRRTLMPTQMGGEGANWTGIAPFTSTDHVFQNLGDGTYFHSGVLAIRAAVAAGVNVTYKLLYNDAVAMTGGQPVEGQLTPTEIARQLLAERVQRVAIVTEDPSRYRSGTLAPPAQVRVYPRDELDRLQTEFRGVRGVTAIVYEQTCAAEKRRRRKRGRMPDPPVRMFINDAVCEGCGDCSVQSNCVSILPKETPLGRRREIDQSSCNKDLSCADGFCPAFVSVHGGSLRRSAPGLGPLPPAPAPPPTRATACNVLVAGIGGTGVVTVGAVLAMAARLDGRGASVIDMTGLAQKNGAVWSHLRIAAAGDGTAPPNSRLGRGDADVLIACDVVAATATDALSTLARARSLVVADTRLQPTAHFQSQPEIALGWQPFADLLAGAVGAEHLCTLEATAAASTLLGSAVGANFVLVGAALQRGALALSVSAVERAIELNGQAVSLNLAALTLGRLAVHDPPAFAALLRAARPSAAEPVPETLDALVEDRVRRLVEYQDERYAERYRRLVDRVREVETACVGDTRLTDSVARNYFRVLAYKDEYEVARLHAAPRFRAELAATFEGDYTLNFHLAPSFLAGTAGGRPTKRRFGPWMQSVFAALAHGRRLRGTWLDPFGWQHERRFERRLIAEYEALIGDLVRTLSRDTHATAIDLATWPDAVRGYGHVKQARWAQVQERIARGRESLRATLEVGDTPRG